MKFVGEVIECVKDIMKGKHLICLQRNIKEVTIEDSIGVPKKKLKLEPPHHPANP